ncbi:hypothetical protein ACOSQ2_007463 [Xanthoceras sorbifolium]
MHQLPFQASTFKAKCPLELIFIDVWGPAPMNSVEGHKYYVIFADCFSKYTWLFPITLKLEVAAIFLHFKKAVEFQLNCKIKCLQTDLGTEYKPSILIPHLQNFVIYFRTSCAYTRQQNGVAEHKHRHIVETGLTLLAHACTPLKFWESSFQAAVLLINNLSTTVLDMKSPYEIFFFTGFLTTTFLKHMVVLVFYILYHTLIKNSTFTLPSMSLLAIVLVKRVTSVFILRAKCIFLEMSCLMSFEYPFSTLFPAHSQPLSSSGSSYYLPLSFLQPVHKNLVQFKNLAGNTSPTIGAPSFAPVLPLHNQSFSTPTTPLLDLHTPTTALPLSASPIATQIPTPVKAPCHPMITRSKVGTFKPKTYHVTSTALTANLEPKSVKETLLLPQWHKAMQEEFSALLRNNTWSLVPLDPSMHLVGCKWVFRVKYNLDGSILKHKARLVAKGFHQTAGVDYFDTFSPIVKASTIRVVFTLAVSYAWDIQQIDKCVSKW